MVDLGARDLAEGQDDVGENRITKGGTGITTAILRRARWVSVSSKRQRRMPGILEGRNSIASGCPGAAGAGFEALSERAGVI